MVSVITPTYGDPRTLVERCIPSVEAQTYADVEHVIVTDGPSALALRESRRRRYVPLGRRWHEFTPEPSWGTMARLVGSALARRDYIAYIDHDDSLLPGTVDKWDAYCRDAREAVAAEQEVGGGYGSDWDLVDRWLRSSATWAFLPEVTVHHFRDSEPDLRRLKA